MTTKPKRREPRVTVVHVNQPSREARIRGCTVVLRCVEERERLAREAATREKGEAA